MSDASEKVLVLGDDTRSFLSIVRSLGSKGIAVDVCPEDWSSPALGSRYIQKTFLLEPYAVAPAVWLETLRKITECGAYDLVIPCNDKTIIPLINNRDRFSNVPISLPNKRAFEVFYDKHLTRLCAANTGVPICLGRLVSSTDTAVDLVEEFGLPLVIKPRRSFDLELSGMRRAVIICRSLEEVVSTLPRLGRPDQYIVESAFDGFGAGISVLARDGNILQAFEHDRVNEPERGGGSSFRKSVPLSPQILRAVEALASETHLDGVAMFEFRKSREDNSFVLIEVNARFWGSLPLAIAAGIDFPYLLFQQHVHDVIREPTAYKTNVYGRNFGADFFDTLQRVSDANGMLSAIKVFLRALGSWSRVLVALEYWDAWSVRDSRPGFRELLGIWRYLFNGVMRKLPTHSALIRWSSHHKIRRLRRKVAMESILVLCQGNIMRSPLAAEIIRRKLPPEFSSVRVKSAGMLPIPSRPSPQKAVLAARSFGVDLCNHRSVFATRASIGDADLIIVFDRVNESSLEQAGFRGRSNVIRLGAFDPDRGASDEIIDPVAFEVKGIEAVYDRIQSSVVNLVDLLFVPGGTSPLTRKADKTG